MGEMYPLGYKKSSRTAQPDSVLTVTIGCIIVWRMKDPAYVADGYEVSHSDKPQR